MKGSIESRVPEAEYRALPGVSITRLKELKRSPKHYRYRLDHPRESAPLQLGRAAHVACLEPERFDRDYAVWMRRTASGAMAPRKGQWWDGFVTEHAGKQFLTDDEAGLARSIQAAVRAHSLAQPYLEAGEPEVTMQWTFMGRPCRGRVDWLTTMDGEPVIVGLKTARDCRPFIFGSAAAKLSYHLQWAFYYDGYLEITGKKPVMREIVVEPEPPHAIAVYRIENDLIEQGREEYWELLKILNECEAADQWPGPLVHEEVLTLPSWVYQVDDDITDLGLEAA
jgi:hypothetical protein